MAANGKNFVNKISRNGIARDCDVAQIRYPRGRVRRGITLWRQCRRLPSARQLFSLGTLTVNVVDTLVTALLTGWFALNADTGQPWRLFLTMEILGSFTTFLTFCLDTVLLYERGEPGMPVLYQPVD